MARYLDSLFELHYLYSEFMRIRENLFGHFLILAETYILIKARCDSSGAAPDLR